MHLPVIQIFNLDLATWVLFGLLNILAGKAIIVYLGYKKGLPLFTILLLVMFSTVGGALGVIFIPSIISVVIGAVIFLFIGQYFLRIQQEIADMVAIYLAVVIAVGRIGCLLNGCCFGSPTDLPWGISYQIGMPAHWLHFFSGQIGAEQNTSLGVHPIQLYETIFLIILVTLIWKFKAFFKSKNTVLLGFLGSYLLFRFLIEFIRDMTNVWWGVFFFGPLSYFQWFLLISASVCLLFAYLSEKNRGYLQGILKRPLNYKSHYLILAGCGITVFCIRSYLLPVHIIQFGILFSISMTLFILDFRERFQYKLIFSAVPISAVSIVLIVSLISEINAQLGDSFLDISNRKTRGAWVYVLDDKNHKLVRLGNENLSFSEFIQKRNNLLLYQKSNIPDSSMYLDIMKSVVKAEIHYYGALSGGNYKYEVEGCGGSVTTYHHTYGGFVGGFEKKVMTEDLTTYLGVKGSIYHDRWTETRSQEPMTQKFNDTYWSLHGYANADFKWIGIGVGISGFTKNNFTDEPNNLFPNAYLRLGPPIFYIEAGLMDRYDIRAEPMTYHLNLGFEGENGFRSRIGLLNLGHTPGYFFSYSAKAKSGIYYEPMLIIGDGFGLNLKVGVSTDLND